MTGVVNTEGLRRLPARRLALIGLLVLGCLVLASAPASAAAGASAGAETAKAKGKGKCKAKGKARGKGKAKGKGKARAKCKCKAKGKRKAKGKSKAKRKQKAKCKKRKGKGKGKGKDEGKESGQAEGAAPATPATPDLQRAVFVGNNWDGTADVLRFRTPGETGTPAGEFTRIARLNIVPDLNQRMTDLLTDPVGLVYFLAVRLLIGEGNDQFVDDMYSSNDGRLLIVSRPSLKDVVGIELATGQIAWRFVVSGQRSDHMGLSPDGKHVAVSASTGNIVHILDVETGEEVGFFPSGDSPHENSYSEDGSRIYHASIGLVYTPLDQPLLDSTKGARYFQVVDTATNEIVKRVDMGQKLAEAGYPNMSSAVRPMALSPDERFVYLQVSFFHGFVEYDLVNDRVTRVAALPNWVPNLPRELYLLDSAHHGIAMNDSGDALCVAGTMSDYVGIVARDTFDYTLLHEGTKPYWSTTSDDGEHCFVSWSGTDSLSAISYASGEEVAEIQVGDHPQRVRTGVVRTDWVNSQGG